ncbi:MAG: hypothetical protein AAFZ17_07710 [Cyanobacteria bacterium J06650_10]
MKWKPLKWWLLCLIALVFAFWLSGTPAVAESAPPDQATFKIGGDLVISADQTVTDAFAIGGDLTLQSGAIVEGDAFAIGGDVQLKENVQVIGDSFAIGGKVIREPGATVGGSEFTVLEPLSGVFDRFGVFGTLYLTNVIFWLVGFVAAVISGLLFLLLLSARIETISVVVRTRPFQSLVYGLGGLLGIGLVTVLLGGSTLGAIAIPLANLIAVYTGLFGLTANCVWLGQRLKSHQKTKHFQHFSLGLLLLFIVSLIPFVGGLLVSLFGLFGFGATLLSRYGASASQPQLPAPLDYLERQTAHSMKHQPE